jgi:hypothetical protein
MVCVPEYPLKGPPKTSLEVGKFNVFDVIGIDIYIIDEYIL